MKPGDLVKPSEHTATALGDAPLPEGEGAVGRLERGEVGIVIATRGEEVMVLAPTCVGWNYARFFVTVARCPWRSTRSVRAALVR